MVMNNRETSPEQRLDLVVCDQQQAYPADATEQYYQNGHYRLDHPGVIRPIPGRPGGGGGGGRYQNGPPPVPGPKPVLNYLKNDQYRGERTPQKQELRTVNLAKGLIHINCLTQKPWRKCVYLGHCCCVSLSSSIGRNWGVGVRHFSRTTSKAS